MIIYYLHWKKTVKYLYLLIFMTFIFLFIIIISENIQKAKYMKQRQIILKRSEPYANVVEESINLTIASIEKQLKNYQSEDTGIQNIIGPFKAGYPVRTIVASITGSGSSYLREVFEFGLPTFYASERVKSSKNEVYKDVMYDLRNILSCELAKSREFNEYMRYSTRYFGINPVTTVCKEKRKMCHNADFASTLCRLYPFHVTKVLRVPVKKLKDLIHDKSLYIRLLLMVRDPRAIIASRHRLIWCLKNPAQCDDATSLCKRMLDDYRHARYLNWKYPQRVSFIRYEDLIVDTTSTMVELFRWYGVELPDSLRSLADKEVNTGSSGSDLFTLSNIRMAQNPFLWREEIDHELVDNIEVVCENVMGAYGYRLSSNTSDLLNSSWRSIEGYGSNPDKYDLFIMSKEIS